MKNHKIVLEICVEDFAETFGRKPKNQKEFSEFCQYCEKGLFTEHIDWAIIFDCAKDEMLR